MSREIGWPMFSDAELGFIGRLLPAMQGAWKARMRASHTIVDRQGEALAGLNVGMIVTDQHGRISETNSVADRLLAAGDGIGSIGGRLIATSAIHRRGLAGLIATAGSPPAAHETPGGDLLIVGDGPDARRLVLSVRPLPEPDAVGMMVARGVLVLIEQPDAPLPAAFERRLRVLFALTAKESALALALASGQSLGEAAAERGIGMPTARTQLAQVFRKTGTTQQSQLVSLLRGILPIA